MLFSFARFFFDFFFSSGNIGSENLRQLLSHVHACMRWIFTTQWTALGPKPKRIFYVGIETNKISNLYSCSIGLKPTCNIFFQHVFKFSLIFFFFRRLRSHIFLYVNMRVNKKKVVCEYYKKGKGLVVDGLRIGWLWFGCKDVDLLRKLIRAGVRIWLNVMSTCN